MQKLLKAKLHGLAWHSIDVVEKTFMYILNDKCFGELSKKELNILFLGALFHDIGKSINDLTVYNQKGENWNFESLHSWVIKQKGNEHFLKYLTGRKFNGHEKCNFRVAKTVLSRLSLINMGINNIEEIQGVINLDLYSNPKLVGMIKKFDRASVRNYIERDYFSRLIFQRKRTLPEMIFLVVNLLQSSEADNKNDHFKEFEGRFYIKYPHALYEIQNWLVSNFINVPNDIRELLKSLININVITLKVTKKLQYFSITFEDGIYDSCQNKYIELNPSILFINGKPDEHIISIKKL